MKSFVSIQGTYCMKILNDKSLIFLDYNWGLYMYKKQR